MKNLNLKTLATGLATLLLMSGIFANQALAAAPPVITSANTKNCVADQVCSYQITATKTDTSNISYGATALPAGLTVNTSTGLISGTPTTAGAFPVTVSATNSSGTGSLAVTFTINPPPAPAARVVVAPSGGNYTTITAALAAINPTATTPCVIEVWPGVYTDPGTVYLKSYVHLKGSGRDVPTVTTSYDNVMFANRLTNVVISGLSITGATNGISMVNTTVTEISENLFDTGIFVSNSGGFSTPPLSIRISENKVYSSGIAVNSTSAVITDNIVSGGGVGIRLDWAGNSIISGNVIQLINKSPRKWGNTFIVSASWYIFYDWIPAFAGMTA